MPIYEYKCDEGHLFETVRKMADDPLTECEVCGAPVQRVFHPIAVHFKGSGFYTTDYAKKKAGAANSDGPSSGSDGGSESSSSDSTSSDSSSTDSSSSDSSSEKKGSGDSGGKAKAGSRNDNKAGAG